MECTIFPGDQRETRVVTPDISQVYHQARSGELKAAVLADCPITEYLPELPDTGVALQLEAVSEAVGEARGNFWGHYNSAVMTSIQGLINLPQTAGNYVSQAVEAVQEMTK